MHRFGSAQYDLSIQHWIELSCSCHLQGRFLLTRAPHWRLSDFPMSRPACHGSWGSLVWLTAPIWNLKIIKTLNYTLTGSRTYMEKLEKNTMSCPSLTEGRTWGNKKNPMTLKLSIFTVLLWCGGWTALSNHQDCLTLDLITSSTETMKEVRW